MAKLEFLANEKKGRTFRVKTYSLPESINSRYDFCWKHIGELFEPLTIQHCLNQGYHSSDSHVCGACPGFVQAPWIDRPQCWGLYGKCWLEEVI